MNQCSPAEPTRLQAHTNVQLADVFQFAGDAACGTGSQSHHERSTKKWFCFRMNLAGILTHISEDAAFSEIV